MSKAKKTKLSYHSRKRANERLGTNFNLNEKEQIFKNALKKGIYYETYKKIDKKSNFRTFLAHKKRDNTRIILYKRIIFITDKYCKTLITLYPVPEEYHKIYDEHIGDVGLSKPFIVYFKDRNTNKFKPIKNFKNEKQAQEFVFKIFYPKIISTKMQEYLKILHNKKKYKIEKVNKMPQNLPNQFALRF